VTEWPRGLVDYTPSGPADEAPSPEEDRDLNRLRLASRLLGHLRARGRSVEPSIRHLREAERAFRAGDRGRCKKLVEDVISEADRLLGTDDAAPAP
jgi:hypothetical protein